MTHPRIEANPDIMGGKPVIRGTRIPVETILRKLGAGLAVEDILADHPRLVAEDILAAPAFAADYLADEEATCSPHGVERNVGTTASNFAALHAGYAC